MELEHLIILGGEAYLPFARSRVKALRATGLAYATQNYQVEGSDITVKITPGHSYIRISGGCRLPMDSGVIDVRTVNPDVPQVAYWPGIRHDTVRMQTYQAGFTADATYPTGWHTNPSKESTGQLAGDVTFSNQFKGLVPPEGADSLAFSAKRVLLPQTNPPTSPPPWEYQADSALTNKKTTAAACPASMFTGRCRNYVQAMYGLPLYEYTKDSSVKSTRTPPTLGYEFFGRPFLGVAAYRRPSDETSYPAVNLTVHSGVHLDAAGKHWLFIPSNGGVSVYPLISSRCGESMRKYLATPAPDEPALSDQDREHLEAYILSECLPDVKNVSLAACTFDVDGAWLSMGYGWHWNYTGLVADMVTTKNVEQDATHQCMSSSHYRITMSSTVSADGVTTWAVAFGMVSGPSLWCTERDNWTITYPLWSLNFQEKLAPKHTTLFACSATFYAFYIGDDLQLCTFTLVRVTGEDESYEGSSEGYSDRYRIGAYALTEGLNGGWGEWKDAPPDYWQATIACGNETHGPMYLGKAIPNCIRTEVGAKTHDGYVSSGFVTNATGGTTVYYDHNPYKTIVFPNWSFMGGYARTQYYHKNFQVTYDYTYTTFQEDYTCVATVIAPQFDAEALYIKSSQTKHRTDLTKEREPKQSQAYDIGCCIVETYDDGSGPVTLRDEWFHYYDSYDSNRDPSLGPPVAADLEVVHTVMFNNKRLVCRAGAQDSLDYAIPFEMHASDYDIVPAGFDTRTSAAQTGTVVLARSLMPAVGMPDTTYPPELYLPIIVGWA